MDSLSNRERNNALNEVRILASIDHANIVQYKEAFTDQQKYLCVVMEFADDGDLYQKITEHRKKKMRFEERQVWRILIAIVKGLYQLHNMSILHRDLKSANVFLYSDDGGPQTEVAKLGDLNVSKLAKQGLLYTQTGTPYYASPEVWKDQPYDSKSDVWSLGCVCYEMCALVPPFRAENMDGLFKKV